MHRSRSLRRVVWVTVVALWLTVAMPPGAIPSGGGFPLDGLLRLLRVSTAWGAPAVWADPDTPDQGRGGPVAREHEVSAAATRANGGVGGPRGKGEGELDPYEPPQAPPPEPRLSGSRASFDPATSRRDAKRSSETTDYYENADGSVTQVLSSGRTNFKNASGDWVPIDTRLVERAGRGLIGDEVRLETAANDIVVSVAGPRREAKTGDASGNEVAGGDQGMSSGQGTAPGQGGSGERPAARSWELASVTLPSGEVFAYGLTGARPVSPVVKGSVSRYANVLPGVDVELEATATGLKETLVLKSARAGSLWVFPLRLEGLTPSIGKDGSVLLADAAGATVAQIPAGQMWDSLFNSQSGEFTASSAVRYELIEVDGGPALRVSVDEGWLRDPARVYPVHVDPSFSVISNGDVFVDNLPSGPSHNGDNLPVGTFDAGASKHRSFLRFDNLGTVAGKNITSARLELYHTWSYDCNHHLPFYIHPVTSWWDVASLTSGSYPGPSIGPAVGSLTITNNYPACTNTGGNRSTGVWWSAWFDPAVVDGWLLNPSANYGLALTASESDSYAWKRFTSADYSSAQFGPKLLVTYEENAEPQISRQYPPSGYTSPTLTPELLAVGSDDSYPLPLKYQFYLFDSTGQTLIAQSSVSTERSWTVPPGELEWGTTYWWTVKAFDGFKESTSQLPHMLTTQIPQPPITSSLSQNTDGPGYEPAIGNYTTSAVDVQVETVGPALAVERFYNSRDPRTTGAFGAGWSSILDAKVTEHKNTSDVVELVVVTYPSGQEIAFGRNPDDGSFTPPLGRYATFETIDGGYRLIDKDGTQWAFTKPLGNDSYAITSMTDAKGRELTFSYTGNQISEITSASGRTLTVTWTTPSGTTTPRVATVSTNPADATNPSGSVSTWTYEYDGPRLVSVCLEDTTPAECHTYEYDETVSLHPTSVLAAGPRTYLRPGLASPSGVVENSAIDSLHVSQAVATDLNPEAGPFPGSPAATFNGTSSRLALINEGAAVQAYDQSVSLWFKTTTPGVLLSEANEPVGSGTAPSQTVWPLYVGLDGRLYGGWHTGSAVQQVSTQTVTDGSWHHAVLTTAGEQQRLFLDGTPVSGSPLSGPVVHLDMTNVAIGAGFSDISPGMYAGSPVTITTGWQVGASLAHTHFGDIDGDGKFEIIAQRPNGNVDAYPNVGGLGSGTYGSPVTIGWDWTPASGVAAAYFADLDGDGRDEIIAQRTNGNIDAFLNVGGLSGTTYGAVATVGWGWTPANGVAAVHFADINGDGRDEIIAQRSNGDIDAFPNMAGFTGGTYGGPVTIATGFVIDSNLAAVHFADINGDGRDELVAQWTNGNIGVYPNSGGLSTNAFGSPVTVSTGWTVGSSLTQIFFHDIDGDGRPELIAQRPNGDVEAYANSQGWRHFNGSVAEVALFDRPLAEEEVALLYATGTTPSSPLTGVIRPSGAQAATIDYDPVAGVVESLVDANGGTWTLGDPVRSGSDQAYVSAVLGAAPTNYWRLTDAGGDIAFNEINAQEAEFDGVTLGVPGPFAEISQNPPTAAGFDGVQSAIYVDDAPVDTTKPFTVTMWVNLDEGDDRDQYLVTMPGSIGNSAFKLLYVDDEYWGVDMAMRDTDNSISWQWLESEEGSVDEDEWVHLAVTSDPIESKIRLYVDGKLVDEASPTVPFNNQATSMHLGHQYEEDYFDGELAEFATYQRALTPDEIAGLYRAYYDSEGGPVKTVTVTDPTEQPAKYVYDLVAGGRLVKSMDTRGHWTTYGYDVRGFLHTVVDPNGNMTVSGHDVRGNIVSYSTCQDRSENKCSTIYMTHWPDNLTATLTPDPRNDAVLTVRDGRSADKDDNTYLTTYEYNTAGDVIKVTDPLGRSTVTTYTDGSGGIPAGLPLSTVNPNGATQTMEYATSGDLIATADTTGRRTEFVRDGLGRIVESTEITDAYPAGLVTKYTYDKASRVVTRTEPGVLDRITAAVHTPYITITYNEDGQELTTTIVDLTGDDDPRTTEKSYNALGQLEWEEDALDRRTSYTYTPYGKVATETGPDGVTTAFTYDSMGNPLTTTLVGWTGHPADPEPATDLLLESRAYDPGGRLATVTDAMGWQTHYTYTDNNLLASVVRYDPSTDDSFTIESYNYDGAGNPIEMVTNNGATTTTATLDAAGRVVTQVVDPTGVNRTTTFTYDAADNVVSHRVSDGSGAVQRVDRLYDLAGRLIGETMYPSATAPALVGRWRFDESSGTTAADSAGNSPAAVGPYGGVSWSAENGGSVVLDGEDGWLTTVGPVLDTTRSYTVSAWVKLDASVDGEAYAASQDGTVRSAFYLGYDDNHNRWTFYLCHPHDEINEGCTAGARSASAPAFDTWVHIAGVYDQPSGKIHLYVNGALQETEDAPTNWPVAAGPLRIGSGLWDGDVHDLFPGSIDDLQVYQDALTGAQVAAIHAGTAPADDVEVLRTSWTVDQRGRATSQTDADGDVTYFDYDEAGRLAVTTFPPVYSEAGDGSAAVFAPVVESAAYNTFGEVVESKDANGRHTFAEFDDAGQLEEIWLPAYTPPGSSTPIMPVRKRFYDDAGRVIETRDALDNPTYYGYDQLGRTVGVEAADGGLTVVTYSLTGQVLSVVDPIGARREATYDYLGRPLTMTEVVRQTEQAYTTTYTYHDEGWLATSTLPGRAATSYTYNNVGEVVRAVDGGGNVALFGYDHLGRRVTSQRQHTSCEPTCADRITQVVEFDGAGRQVTTKVLDAADAIQSQTSVAYSRDSLPAELTNPRGVTSTFTYDALGRLTGMVEPVSAMESITTSFGYDPTGALTRFTDGRGNHFRTTYNVWGLPETQTEPGGVTFTTIYDAAGRVVGSQLPGGVSTTSTYDDVGRLTSMSGSGAEVATATRTFGYDLAGRMTSLSGPGGSNTLTYDDRDLLTSVTGPSGDSSYTYTPDGLLESRTDAAGTTEYVYDTIGRLAEISNTTAGLELDYQYNTRSQVSQITYGGTSAGNKRRLFYDTLGRIEIDEVLTSSDALVGRITYDWDENSNLTGKTTVGFAGSAVNTYAYDLADRLISWNNGSTTETYAYDASGNRTEVGSTTFTYNARNQLVSSSDGTTYTYTPRGTLATTTVPGVGTLATESDAFGQVIRQYDTPSTYSEYSYDGLGRVLQAGFEYTGLGNDLAEDPSGTYVRGPAGDLVGVNSTYAWTDLHTDVVGLFTATGTALTGSVTYSPFGKVLASSGMQGSLGFQSEYTDALTGKVNMHARWYNPDTGQFDSRDPKTVSPVPTSGSANRYAYGAGNPLVRIDPTGHDWMSGCSNMMMCVVQGFVNSFDVFSIISNFWSALKNIGDTIKGFANSLKNSAEQWKGRIRGMLPGSICNNIIFGWACDSLATIGGWACAASGVCDIINDCVSAFSNASSRNTCGIHVGEALAEVFMGILSGGAAAVGKFLLKNLIKKFNLPDRNKSSGNGGGSNNGNHDSDISNEKDLMRDRDKDRGGSNSNGNSGGGSGSGGSSWGGSGGGGSGPNPPSNPIADRPPTDPVHPAPNAPEPPQTLDLSKVDPSQHEKPGTRPNAPSCNSCPCHSFDPDTPVLMADGSAKAIEDVKVGDEVVATDPDTGETSEQPVTALHVNLDRELTTLTLAPLPAEGTATIGEGNGDRSTRGPTDAATSKLETTHNHPFWDVTTASWVDAADLIPGQSVVTSPDGQQQLVVAVDNHTGAAEMRDLTVANIHTYYVLAGNTPVLVHNTDPVPGPACGTNLPDPSEGYPSYRRPGGGWITAHGEAGPGMQWEHVVEQSQMLPHRSGFPSEIINHTDNILPVPAAINSAKNAYYGSVLSWTNNKTLRDFLNGTPWHEQWDLGMFVIRQLQSGAPLPM